MTRGGNEMTRGGNEMNRGGNEMNRGGNEMNRGGNEMTRGGNEMNRGGNEMTRGGDEMNHGGNEMTRGGNAPPCFFKADVSRRKCRQYFSTLPSKVLNLCKYLGIFKEKHRRKKRQCLRSDSPFAPKSKETRTKALPVQGVTT